MDMTRYGSGGEYLQAKTLMERNISEIPCEIKEVSETQFDKGKKAVLHLKYKDEDFKLTLNVTNTNALIDKFTAESDNWIGQDILIKLEKVTAEGKFKGDPCLRIA